ncbi:hypothetical protein F5146DRAFT_1102794 [Armillaria mellea]|nr:hypothetical protein F5146DRAFT_1102794 [Armillaria mellea]
MNYCLETFFTSANINQIMLFCRAPSSAESPTSAPSESGLPPPLISLLDARLAPDIHALLFPAVPTRARQAIINLYDPGEGITPHVDLLKRFGDGIVGAWRTRRMGCTSRREASSSCRETARYKWTHGIEGTTRDFVQSPDTAAGRWVKRTMRMSITFRWLLPGAEVVGGA